MVSNIESDEENGQMACRGIREESGTVSKCRTDVSRPDLYILDKIAALLDIGKRELLTGKD